MTHRSSRLKRTERLKDELIALDGEGAAGSSNACKRIISSVRRLPVRFTTSAARIPEQLELADHIIPPTKAKVKTPDRTLMKTLREKANKLKRKQKWAVLRSGWGNDGVDVDLEEDTGPMDTFPDANERSLLSNDTATYLADRSVTAGLSKEVTGRIEVNPSPLPADVKTSFATPAASEPATATQPSYEDAVGSDVPPPPPPATSHNLFQNARNVEMADCHFNNVADGQSIVTNVHNVNNVNTPINGYGGESVALAALSGIGIGGIQTIATQHSHYLESPSRVVERLLHRAAPIIFTGILLNGATNVLRMILHRPTTGHIDAPVLR